MSNLGNLYAKQCIWNKAAELYEKTGIIKTRIYGPQHPTVATNYYNIGRLWSKQGETTLALKYLNDAYMISQRVYGDHGILTKKILIQIYMALGFSNEENDVWHRFVNNTFAVVDLGLKRGYFRRKDYGGVEFNPPPKATWHNHIETKTLPTSKPWNRATQTLPPSKISEVTHLLDKINQKKDKIYVRESSDEEDDCGFDLFF